MSKVKDFVLEEDNTEEVAEPSYEEVMQYYDAKRASFEINVANFNNNLLGIIEMMKDISVFENEKLTTEADKVILKAIKMLKFTDDEG